MKQKDLSIIIVVAFLSAIVSFLISNKLFVTAENRQQKVEVVDVIVADFNEPSKRYFNAESINPTQNSQLNSTNQTPFNASTQ
ncbi:hypothetical protein IPL68_03800 [Candidatus Saccharibacteria bacterium]|nr:MAG: hypothetical protein IPL68_03800 [Candidatus Saccharibacteria bacterium]